MNRRNVLLGLGTAAAGSGIVFGSGAFTQVQASRDVTIRIDEDTDALLALDANDNIASVDNDGDTGELFIDTDKITSEDGNEGFNSGAQVQIGETEESFGDTVVQGSGAFSIANNFDNVPGDENSNNEIDIGIDLSDLTTPKSDLEFVVTTYNGNGNGNRDFRISPSDGREVITDVAPSEELHVAIFLDTASVSNPEDFDGEVVISAGPSLGEDEGFPTDDELVEPGQVLNVNSGATFDSEDTDTPIQDAVGDAESFDTLRVGAKDSGSYEESVTINVEGLTLEAADGAEPTIDISADSRTNIPADNVTVSGFSVVFEGQAAYIRGDNVTVEDNTFELESGTTSTGYALRYEGLTSDGEVRNNEFVGITNDGQGEFGNGVIISGADGHEVVGNTFDGNSIGVNVGFAQPAGELLVSDNTFTSQDDFAVALNHDDSESPNITVSSNDFDSNLIGVLVLAGGDISVSDNAFTGDSGTIYVDDTTVGALTLSDVLNNEGNTFDPDGEVDDESDQIVAN